MVKYIDDEVHIENVMDLENEMCKYNCNTKEELNNILWHDYGVALILEITKRMTNFTIFLDIDGVLNSLDSMRSISLYAKSMFDNEEKTHKIYKEINKFKCYKTY